MLSGRPYYSDFLLEHFRHPRHPGHWPPTDSATLTGQAHMPETGSIIRLQLRLRGDLPDTITDTRFRAYGCAATIAAGSWLAERLSGMSLGEARTLRYDAIETALALPPAKVHCAVLAVQALAAALATFTEQQHL